MKTRIQSLFAASVLSAVLPVSAGSAVLLLVGPAVAAPSASEMLKDESGKLLTGDKKLACEAIMCLSSGTRPSECNPALHRYFSIHHRKLGDTIRARRDFLRQCPASGDDGMPGLIDAIADGAGRCDAASLNKKLRKKVKVQRCYTVKDSRKVGFGAVGNGGRQECRTVETYQISNVPPSYCRAYLGHAWTDVKASTRYEGQPENGGKWVGQ